MSNSANLFKLNITMLLHFSVWCIVEMEKRKKSAYSAIGFNYDTPSHTGEDLDGVPMEEATQPRSAMMYDYNMSKRMEHPSTATVDHGTEEDQFILPPDFPIPGGIQLVSIHSVKIFIVSFH